jgi:Xaa-Pro aminopeptidase
VDSIARSLVRAQDKAEALFAAVIAGGVIQPGKLESEISAQIHALARSQFGLRRHWHKRIARAGPNTMLTYHDEPADRRVGDDDIVYLDFGPVFEEWEADFGRTYAVGADPVKHRLIDDLSVAFHQGKDLFQRTPDLTAGELYDYVAGLAHEAGWEFGAPTAGHLIGEFPHERSPRDLGRFSIRHGNELPLREPDGEGRPRHWILEIHFIDRTREIGGFFEQLLTA